MQTIRINKEKLIKKLEDNRAEHIEEYKKAVLGYKAAAKKALQKKLNELKKLKENEIEDFDLYFNQVKPDSHVDDFDIALGMLAISEDTSIDLSASDYRKYYLNEWEWKRQWLFSNTQNMAMYAKTYEK